MRFCSCRGRHGPPVCIVHVQSSEGEAKFWLEPAVELAHNYGLSEQQLRSLKALIEAHENDIRSSWARHFGS